MSNESAKPNERQRSLPGIILVLLLVCGCIGIMLGPGMPVFRNVLGSGLVATQVNNEATPSPAGTQDQIQTPTAAATLRSTPNQQSDITDTPQRPGPNGACLDPCNPNNSTCLAGLSCVQRAINSNEYICYNRVVCEPDITQVPQATEQPVCMCGDGVCEQDRCNELQQNCPADCGSGPNPSPPPVGAGPICGDGACNGRETCSTCSTDCGTC